MTVNQTSALGILVYDANASDPAADGGPSNPLTYTLGGADVAAFTINASDGKVTLTGNPNYEGQSSYSFDVTEIGRAACREREKVRLAANHLDEVAPTFSSGTVATAINENSGAGQMVYADDATDSPDYGRASNPPTYTLGGADVAAFTINASDGKVTLTGNPNYEGQSSYSFDVTEIGRAACREREKVRLAANHLDEVAPTFSSGTVATAINENSGAGQMVYADDATDSPDYGRASNPPTYTLGGADVAAFTINASDGKVTLTGNPNYEGQSSYSFDVTATDTAGNATTQTVSLAIDRKSVVEGKSASGRVATAINENSGAGQMVYDAEAGGIAADGVPSIPPSSPLSGADVAAFTINASDGKVTLTGNPNYEGQSSYSFDVTATDTAGNATTQTVSLA